MAAASYVSKRFCWRARPKPTKTDLSGRYHSSDELTKADASKGKAQIRPGDLACAFILAI